MLQRRQFCDGLSGLGFGHAQFIQVVKAGPELGAYAIVGALSRRASSAALIFLDDDGVKCVV